jgi:hypothetical protein
MLSAGGHMEELLDNPLVLVGIVVAVLIVVVKWVAGRLAGKAATPATYVNGRCDSCGWEGSVGKYNRRCPKCRGDVSTLPG